MTPSAGETGEKPVRDRRRKAHTVTILIRMPRSGEPPLEEFLRRLDCDAPKSEYPDDVTPNYAADIRHRGIQV